VRILQGSGGWQQHTINVPSWADRLKLEVEWRGLQLRWWIDDTVWGLGFDGQNEVWTIVGGQPPHWDGWGGQHTMELTGILVDYIGDWTVYACGAPPPPPPTPTPLPTPTPRQGPGCVSIVGEPAEWVDSALTLYGPASGWYIIRVYEDQGASGAQGVRWRLQRNGFFPADEQRYGNGSFELRAGETATITILSATGPGVAGLWVAVDAVCQGLELTPIAPGINDIKPVEFGIDIEGTDCPFSIPRVVFSFNPPGLPALNLAFDGVKVCFIYKRLRLGWGDFNVIDWAVPLLSLGIVWSAWLALRRG
jgi:hypothetical protein